jgi:hypothetical protein
VTSPSFPDKCQLLIFYLFTNFVTIKGIAPQGGAMPTAEGHMFVDNPSGDNSQRSTSGSLAAVAVVSVSVRSLVDVFEKESLTVTQTTVRLQQRQQRGRVGNWKAALIASETNAGDYRNEQSNQQPNLTAPIGGRSEDDPRKASLATVPPTAPMIVILPDVVVCSTSESIGKNTDVKRERQRLQQQQQQQKQQQHNQHSQHVHELTQNLSLISSATPTSDGSPCQISSHIEDETSKVASISMLRSSATGECTEDDDIVDKGGDIPTPMLFAAVKNIFERRARNNSTQHRHRINGYQHQHDANRRPDQGQHNGNETISSDGNSRNVLAHAFVLSEADRQRRIRVRKSAFDSISNAVQQAQSPQQRQLVNKREECTAAVGSVERLKDMFNGVAVNAAACVAEGDRTLKVSRERMHTELSMTSLDVASTDVGIGGKKQESSLSATVSSVREETSKVRREDSRKLTAVDKEQLDNGDVVSANMAASSSAIKYSNSAKRIRQTEISAAEVDELSSNAQVANKGAANVVKPSAVDVS